MRTARRTRTAGVSAPGRPARDGRLARDGRHDGDGRLLGDGHDGPAGRRSRR